MEIERETMVEIVVSGVAVGLFVVIMVGIGLTYYEGGEFAGQGALALVGAILLFILGMAGVGVYMAYWKN